MPRTEYQLIHGDPDHVNGRLIQAATSGWKPILMSSTHVSGGGVASVIVYVILEHVPGA